MNIVLIVFEFFYFILFLILFYLIISFDLFKFSSPLFSNKKIFNFQKKFLFLIFTIFLRKKYLAIYYTTKLNNRYYFI